MRHLSDAARNERLALTQKSSHVALTGADSSHTATPPASATSGRFDAIVVPGPAGRRPSTGRRTWRLSSTSRWSRCAVARRACRKQPRGIAARGRLPGRRRRRAVGLPARLAAASDSGAALPRRERQPAVGPQPQAQPRASDRPPARLQKVLFLDDDIGEQVRGRSVGLPSETARRLAAELDARQVAGLTCHQFPDNSVVCHARRLAGYRQDTFVSGAGVGGELQRSARPILSGPVQRRLVLLLPARGRA